MEKGEEKIPEGFIEAVKFVCDNADVVFDILNRLLEDYLLGKDIRKNLRSFKKKNKNVFLIIREILNKSEIVENWLSNIELEEDKRWIFSKLANYSILKDEFNAIWFEEHEFINPITTTEVDYEYNEELQIPFIEVRALSFGKEILYFKEPLDYLLWLIANLTEKSLESLEEFSDKPIREDAISFMREIQEIIVEKSKQMLNILNNLTTAKKKVMNDDYRNNTNKISQD